jgi:hypothetical protein
MELLMLLLLLPVLIPVTGLERLQVFARLESNGLSGRDVHFRAGSGVPADAGLSRFHGKHTKATQLDPIIGLEGVLHAIENGVDCLLRLCFADSRPLHDLIHKIEFDHWNLRISFVSIFLPSGDALGNAN